MVTDRKCGLAHIHPPRPQEEKAECSWAGLYSCFGQKPGTTGSKVRDDPWRNPEWLEEHGTRRRES